MSAQHAFDDGFAKLRSWLRKAVRNFDARNQRERLVLVTALVAASFWLCDKAWLTPAMERSRAASARLVAAHGELNQMRADTSAVITTGIAQERQLRSDITASRQRTDIEASALRDYENTLVGADHMVGLLEAMLPHNGRIKVRELKSLGRTDLMTATLPAPAASASAAGVAGAAVAATGGPSLYRHGVELVLEGGWGDLVDYMNALETMPRRVLWGGVTMKVEQYPKVVLTLRLYTLSLDRGWLEI